MQKQTQRFPFYGYHLILALLLSVLFCWQTSEARPHRFHQNAEPIASLFGTEIGDIVWSGRYLWVATESGVARLDPSQTSGAVATDWITFTELNGLGRGSISALDAVGDRIWVATLVDTTVEGVGTFQMGTGLSFSNDAGQSWNHISNEAIFDTARSGFELGPTTAILNGCFDVAINGDEVWAVFLAGSSVRTRDDGQTWERVLPGGAERIAFFASDTAADSLRITADSLANEGADEAIIAALRAGADSLASQEFLHRTFSVLAYGDTLWIGTSSGISRTLDGGQTWKNIKVRVDDTGQVLPGNIGANWVVALERQILPDGSSAIWAGTNVTGLPGEVSSMSVSRDHGETWTITGPTFAWDFTFTDTDNLTWAATNQGLLASSNTFATSGRTWEQIPVAAGETLEGVFVGLETVDNVLWAGAENGLGRSADEGDTWRIIRDLVRTSALDSGTFVSTGGVADSTSQTYAAPNPFSPSEEKALIVFSLAKETQVDIDIYDFASRKVRVLTNGQTFLGGRDHREPWDGRDDGGQSVANGVYFYRITLDSGQQAFGKVVVLD